MLHQKAKALLLRRIFCVVGLLIWQNSHADETNTIILAANPSSAAQQELYHLLAQRFEKLNPDIRVKVSSQSLEDHKKRVINFYRGEDQTFDILFGYAGTQLNEMVASGQIAPLTKLWEEKQLDSKFSPLIRPVVFYHNQPYAMPISYYQWGLYYRKSMFERWGISPPQNWTQLLTLIEELKRQNITPLNLSGASSWSSLAWFDYLTLRLLGKAHYLDLLSGKASFDTPDVRKVLIHWQQLVDAGAFESSHSQLTWSSILPFFYRGKIAMMLNGNFFLAHVPAKLREDIGFAPFVAINTDMPRYENAPTDIAVLTKRAENNPHARSFMTYLSELASQALVSEYAGKISPHIQHIPDDKFLLKQGKQHIQTAAGLVQYFDREANDAFTQAAGPLFVGFMTGATSVDEVIEQLEQARHEHLIPKKAP